MDLDAAKFKPLDPVIATSVRLLAKSVNAIASQLVADLYSGDIVATLLWAHGELEKLSEVASAVSEEALLKEQGR